MIEICRILANGLREGKGNLSSSDNKYLYDEGWKNDKFEGEGTLISPKVGKYIGKFKDGLFDGHGTLFTPKIIFMKENIYVGKKVEKININ